MVCIISTITPCDGALDNNRIRRVKRVYDELAQLEENDKDKLGIAECESLVRCPDRLTSVS